VAAALRCDAALARHLDVLRPFVPADVGQTPEPSRARAAKPAEPLARLQPHVLLR
jgi:hypothetical protein